MTSLNFQPSPNFTFGSEFDPDGFYITESGDGSSEILQDLLKVDYAKIVISLIICIFGLIGNLVAIFVIVVLKEYQKSVTHWYVLHLAIADSVFLISLPFQVSEDLNNEWILPEWMCKAKESILFLNYYASILFLVVMSIDRYIAVCHSFSTALQKLRKRGSSFIIAMSVWAIALLLCVPVMLYSFKAGIAPTCRCTYTFPKAEEMDPSCVNVDPNDTIQFELCERFNRETSHCIDVTEYDLDQEENRLEELFKSHINNSANDDLDRALSRLIGSSAINEDENENVQLPSHGNCNYWDTAEGFRIFLVLNFALMFVLPLMIMLWCYGLIVKKLSDTRVKTQTPGASFTQSDNQKPREKKKSSSRSDKDRRRVTIMCAALVSCFIVCWLPFHAVHLAKIVGIRNTAPETCATFQVVGTLLAYFNSALNPYLYSFLGTNFARRWSTATVTLRQTVSRQRNSSSNSGSIRHLSDRKSAKRKRRSTKTTKVLGNQLDTTTKNSVSETSPAFIEVTRPLGSHSETRNISSSRYYTEQIGQEITNDYSSDYKHNFSTTES